MWFNSSRVFSRCFSRSWRKPSAVLLGLLSCLIAGGTLPAVAAQNWAVLIGVSEYRNRNTITPLGGAANDARALQRILRERLRVPDANIQLLVADQGGTANPPAGQPLPDRSEILSALERLRYKVKPDDTIWLFFAGHGVSINNQTFLLPSDTQNLNDNALVDTALPVSKIKAVLNTIPARARILLFDMCRSKPRMGARGESDPNVLTTAVTRSLDFSAVPPPVAPKKPVKAPVTVTLFACSPNQQSYEWLTKGRGFFSYFLEEGLAGKAANAQHQVTVNGLADYVRTNVKQTVLSEMNLVQEPLLSAGGPGAASYVIATVASGGEWTPLETKDTGGTTVAAGTPLPPVDSQSARMEFYSNDPTITAVVNGVPLTSGGARTEPTADGAPRQFLYQGKTGGSLLRTQYGRSLQPGETAAFMLLRTPKGVLKIGGWPSLSEFLQMPPVVRNGDEKAANKGLSAGEWELSGFKIRVADEFTQTIYSGKRSLSSVDPAHPDTEQKFVIVEANLRNRSKQKRYWYTLRVEGGETILPFEESGLTDKNGATFPLIGQDADPGGDMKWGFDSGERRAVRWIFRMPKEVKLNTITQVRLGVLWTSDDPVLQRAQLVIKRK